MNRTNNVWQLRPSTDATAWDRNHARQWLRGAKEMADLADPDKPWQWVLHQVAVPIAGLACNGHLPSPMSVYEFDVAERLERLETQARLLAAKA